MPIIKLTHKDKDYYLMWSEVVDAPVTYGMSLDEFKEYYRNEYGESGMRGLPEKLELVEKYGVSNWPHYHSADEYIKFNRAGHNQKQITKAQIIKIYCIDKS